MSLTPSISNFPMQCSSADSPESTNPMKQPQTASDRMMQELQRCEAGLHAWLGESAANADWLVRDPVGALRAANLGMDEQVLLELEATMKMIAKKIAALDERFCA
jgi:hypothetical protein